MSGSMRSPEDGCCAGLAIKMMSGKPSILTCEDMVEVYLKDHLSVSGAAVLELGPGVGHATKPMLALGAKVYAVEISSKFREILASTFEPSIASGKLIISGDDAKLIPAETASLDAAVGVNVVYFLDPMDEYHKEMARVLKPGGLLVWAVKDVAKDAGGEYTNANWDLVVKSMQESGFRDCRVEPYRLSDNGMAKYQVILGVRE